MKFINSKNMTLYVSIIHVDHILMIIDNLPIKMPVYDDGLKPNLHFHKAVHPLSVHQSPRSQDLCSTNQ